MKTLTYSTQKFDIPPSQFVVNNSSSYIKDNDIVVKATISLKHNNNLKLKWVTKPNEYSKSMFDFTPEYEYTPIFLDISSNYLRVSIQSVKLQPTTINNNLIFNGTLSISTNIVHQFSNVSTDTEQYFDKTVNISMGDVFLIDNISAKHSIDGPSLSVFKNLDEPYVFSVVNPMYEDVFATFTYLRAEIVNNLFKLVIDHASEILSFSGDLKINDNFLQTITCNINEYYIIDVLDSYEGLEFINVSYNGNKSIDLYDNGVPLTLLCVPPRTI